MVMRIKPTTKILAEAHRDFTAASPALVSEWKMPVPRIHNSRCLNSQEIFADLRTVTQITHESVRSRTKLKRTRGIAAPVFLAVLTSYLW
jgi:hypothetical protein